MKAPSSTSTKEHVFFFLSSVSCTTLGYTPTDFALPTTLVILHNATQNTMIQVGSSLNPCAGSWKNINGQGHRSSIPTFSSPLKNSFAINFTKINDINNSPEWPRNPIDIDFIIAAGACVCEPWSSSLAAVCRVLAVRFRTEESLCDWSLDASCL